MKNARFKVYHKGTWVILTLRPEQSVAWDTYFRHDEGWSSAYTVWRYLGGMLHREYGSDGTDCDGRLSTYGVDVADLPPSGEVPLWRDVDGGQRDYRAEAAGY